MAPKNGSINEDFDPEPYTQRLRKAVKGFGTDEDEIINVIGETTPYERQRIRQYYHNSLGRYLLTDLGDDLSGDFKHLVLALFKYSNEYYGDELHRAIYYTWGTDEDALNDIVITRSNEEIALTKRYFDYYKKYTLASELNSKKVFKGYSNNSI